MPKQLKYKVVVSGNNHSRVISIAIVLFAWKQIPKHLVSLLEIRMAKI